MWLQRLSCFLVPNLLFFLIRGIKSPIRSFSDLFWTQFVKKKIKLLSLHRENNLRIFVREQGMNTYPMQCYLQTSWGPFLLKSVSHSLSATRHRQHELQRERAHQPVCTVSSEEPGCATVRPESSWGRDPDHRPELLDSFADCIESESYKVQLAEGTLPSLGTSQADEKRHTPQQHPQATVLSVEDSFILFFPPYDQQPTTSLRWTISDETHPHCSTEEWCPIRCFIK